MSEWPKTADEVYAKIEFGEWTEDSETQQLLVPEWKLRQWVDYNTEAEKRIVELEATLAAVRESGRILYEALLLCEPVDSRDHRQVNEAVAQYEAPAALDGEGE